MEASASFLLERELPAVRDCGAELLLGASAEMLPMAANALALAARGPYVAGDGDPAAPVSEAEVSRHLRLILAEIATYGFCVVVAPPAVLSGQGQAGASRDSRPQMLVFLGSASVQSARQAGNIEQPHMLIEPSSQVHTDATD